MNIENDAVGDFTLIEKANFSSEAKFGVQMTVSALHLLRTLSNKRGIPLEKITAKDIIDDFASEARQRNGIRAGTSASG